MALAAVPDPTPPSLADRLAEAQRAEVGPRSRVAELQAAFDGALAAKKYADADRLQGELQAAREALVQAEGVTRGFREGLAFAEAQRATEKRALAEAQRRDEARRIIEDAMAAEKRALDSLEQAIAETYATLDAAREAFQRAQAWETKTAAERLRIRDARVMLEEIPYNTPPLPKPNKMAVLRGNDSLMRELMRGYPE